MSKRKSETNEVQTDFFAFIPTTHDPALEKEVWECEGKRSAPDDSKLLTEWRRSYFEEWCRQHPAGFCAKYSEWRE